MSNTKKLKLTKIVLETEDGKQVELTIDEAKELHDQLHTLFGGKTTYIPSTPIVIERNRWNPQYHPYWYDVICTADTPRFVGLGAQLGGLGAQCSIRGNSGLSVSYCGEAL